MIRCLKMITLAIHDDKPPSQYACLAWHYHGASLLSNADDSQEFDLLFRDASAEMEKIDWEWIRIWMAEALCWAGLGYLKVPLPPSDVSFQLLFALNLTQCDPKGMPEARQALRAKLESINMIFNVSVNFFLRDNRS
jgi:hypothetical protein